MFNCLPCLYFPVQLQWMSWSCNECHEGHVTKAMSRKPCREGHVTKAMSRRPCRKGHVTNAMSRRPCREGHVAKAMSPRPCCEGHVAKAMSQRPCHEGHVAKAMSRRSCHWLVVHPNRPVTITTLSVRHQLLFQPVWPSPWVPGREGHLPFVSVGPGSAAWTAWGRPAGGAACRRWQPGETLPPPGRQGCGGSLWGGVWETEPLVCSEFQTLSPGKYIHG